MDMIKIIRQRCPRLRWYVGIDREGRYQMFQSSSVPTEETHGCPYGSVIGPFRTWHGAKFMKEYGGSPQCQTVDDAEALAKAEKVLWREIVVVA